MPVLSSPAFGPRTALAYVTGGSLLTVWTLVWYFTRETELTRSMWFWFAGFLLTGLTFVILGLLLGPLGRAAREAELPPGKALDAEAAIQKTAAANPPAVVGGVAPGVGAGAAVPAGQVVPAVANPAAPTVVAPRVTVPQAPAG